MKYFLLFIWATGICFALQAQELISQPGAKYITKFPFKLYTGGVMIVKAQFESLPDSLSFIVDTGGGGVSLDSSTCADLKIATKETDTVITGIGGRRKVHYVFGKTLKLPGLNMNRLNFHVVNYDILSSTYGEKIDGILGYSFFNRYVVKINFDSQHIEVYTRGKLKYPNGGTVLHPVFTSLPIQQLLVKDNRKLTHQFYMDTGAGLCFLMSERFAADSNMLRKKQVPLVTQAEGIAGRLQMRLTVVRELKIGPYRFTKVPTYLYNDEYNVTGYPFSGGLVGNDLLRRFNMTFNYSQREVHLIPNSHFYEPFDYSYNGLGMYLENDRIVVLDIAPNSPASLAGFKINDEIISVGSNFTGNLQSYKTQMQAAGERIKVIIKRDGKLDQLILRPWSIL